MRAIAQTTEIPVGVIKQFGPWGPEYEVLGAAEAQSDRRMVRIVMVRTGEELDYPLDAVLQDPEAQ